MDDWDENGIFNEVFRDNVEASADKEARYLLDYEQDISNALMELAPTRQERNALAREEWNDELKANVNRYNLIKMLAYLGSDSSSYKLCSTGETSTHQQFFKNSTLWVAGDIEQTRENLIDFLGRTLTEAEVKYTQRIVDAAGKSWTEMQEVNARTKGFNPPKVEALPVLLRIDGKNVVFKGGYIPLIRYGEEGSKPQGVNIITPTDEIGNVKNIRTMSTTAGSNKRRDKSVYPLDLRPDAEVFLIKDTIHDLAFRETVDTMRKLLNDGDLYGELKKKMGVKRFKILFDYALNCAKLGDFNEIGELGRAANLLRQKLTNVVIMGNLKVIFQNLGNIMLYGGNIDGYTHTMTFRAIMGFYKNIKQKGFWKESTDFVYDKSAWMRERSQAPDISLAIVKEEQGRQDGYKKFVQDVCVDAMVLTDNMTAIPVWLDAYHMKLKEGLSEANAVRYADTVIRRGLGATRKYDVAPIMRSGPWAKLFTMFQSFFNARYNEAVREVGIVKQHINAQKYKEAFKRALSYIIAKHLLFTMLSTGLAFANPFDEEDEDGWNNWLKELLQAPHSMLGPVGGFTNIMASLTMGMQTYGYRLSPIQNVPEQVIRMGSKVKKVTTGKAETSELVEPAAGLMGLWFEIPAQFNKIIFNAYDILYNDMTPRASDLIRRRPKKERDE